METWGLLLPGLLQRLQDRLTSEGVADVPVTESYRRAVTQFLRILPLCLVFPCDVGPRRRRPRGGGEIVGFSVYRPRSTFSPPRRGRTPPSRGRVLPPPLCQRVPSRPVLLEHSSERLVPQDSPRPRSSSHPLFSLLC